MRARKIKKKKSTAPLIEGASELERKLQNLEFDIKGSRANTRIKRIDTFVEKGNGSKAYSLILTGEGHDDGRLIAYLGIDFESGIGIKSLDGTMSGNHVSQHELGFRALDIMLNDDYFNKGMVEFNGRLLEIKDPYDYVELKTNRPGPSYLVKGFFTSNECLYLGLIKKNDEKNKEKSRLEQKRAKFRREQYQNSEKMRQNYIDTVKKVWPKIDEGIMKLKLRRDQFVEISNDLLYMVISPELEYDTPYRQNKNGIRHWLEPDFHEHIRHVTKSKEVPKGWSLEEYLSKGLRHSVSKLISNDYHKKLNSGAIENKELMPFDAYEKRVEDIFLHNIKPSKHLMSYLTTRQ